MKNKKGISLIVLIVTIIVIIILAAAVILTLNQNNPIDSSRIAQLADNRASLNSAVSLYYGKKMAETQGMYDTETVLIFGNNIGDKELVATGVREVNSAVGRDPLGTSQYYRLQVSSLDITEPKMTGATWYVDVNTGLVYLAYNAKTDIPSWMFTDGDARTTMDSTLDQFVRVVKDNNLVEVGKAS